MSELRYFTWISLALPKGSPAVNRILERYETAYDFYADCQKGLDGIDFLSPSNKKSIKETKLSDADEVLNRCERLGIRAVCPSDELFPKRLLNICGTPAVLFYVGDISELDTVPSVCVVGTRHPMDKSKQITGSVCRSLSASGIRIISGCAVGIDEYAHRGAIKAKGKTIGVLGCGIDVNYPRKNAGVKNKLLRLGGALISEYPPGTKASGKNFPVRNRIMAGLADAVFMAETPERSGALITAGHAMEQGKDVFCIHPLGFGDKRFAGCVKYLRAGAIPVYDASDILIWYYLRFADKLNAQRIFDIIENDSPIPDIGESVEIQYAEKNSSEKAAQTRVKKPISGISEKALRLYSEALDFEPASAEMLAQKAQMPINEVLAALTELEISGAVVQTAGNKFSVAEYG